MVGAGKAERRYLYMEGAGVGVAAQRDELRRAMSELLARAGVRRKPRIVACGGRKRAYDMFCTAIADGEDACLLVDAEEVVAQTLSVDPKTDQVMGADPWAHVLQRQGDGWKRPAGTTDAQLHFMTVTMETWLLSDRDALAKVFPGIDVSKLPPEGSSLEQVSKAKANQTLVDATKDTKAGPYGKGRHSFKVLARVSPEKLRALVWARRFLDEMKRP